MQVRPFTQSDWDDTWQIIKPVFRAGETFPCAPDITEHDAHHYWVASTRATYVALDDDGTIIGSYYLRPNQPELGGHVCNCGYIVAESARGQGVASTLCQHSQAQAQELGFTAMQYNLVVATNEAAVHIWKKNGLKIIGTLPGAFRHARLGLVDAYVMYKTLITS